MRSVPEMVGPEIAGLLIARPTSTFVELPPSLKKTIESVKTPSLAAVKLTTTFEVPNGGKANELPETIENSERPATAEPVSKTPPALLTTKLASAVFPGATNPKSKLGGETAS